MDCSACLEADAALGQLHERRIAPGAIGTPGDDDALAIGAAHDEAGLDDAGDHRHRVGAVQQGRRNGVLGNALEVLQDLGRGIDPLVERGRRLAR